MSTRHAIHSTRFRQPRLAVAGAALAPREINGPEGLSARQAFAMFALVGIVLVLMVAPVVVAGVSILDSNLLNGLHGWLEWSGVATYYLDLARLGSTLALAGLVSSASNDSAS